MGAASDNKNSHNPGAVAGMNATLKRLHKMPPKPHKPKEETKTGVENRPKKSWKKPEPL